MLVLGLNIQRDFIMIKSDKDKAKIQLIFTFEALGIRFNAELRQKYEMLNILRGVEQQIYNNFGVPDTVLVSPQAYKGLIQQLEGDDDDNI